MSDLKVYNEDEAPIRKLRQAARDYYDQKIGHREFRKACEAYDAAVDEEDE